MQRFRTVTSLDVSAVAGHHAMPAALLFLQKCFFYYYYANFLMMPVVVQNCSSDGMRVVIFPIAILPVVVLRNIE